MAPSSRRCLDPFHTPFEVNYGFIWDEEMGNECSIRLDVLRGFHWVTLVAASLGEFFHLSIFLSKVVEKRAWNRTKALKLLVARFVPGTLIWLCLIMYAATCLGFYDEGVDQFPGSDPWSSFYQYLLGIATDVGWTYQMGKYVHYLEVKERAGQREFNKHLRFVKPFMFICKWFTLPAGVCLFVAPLVDESQRKSFLQIFLAGCAAIDLSLTIIVRIVFLVIKDLTEIIKMEAKQGRPSSVSQNTEVEASGSGLTSENKSELGYLFRVARNGLKQAMIPLYYQFAITVLFDAYALVSPTGFLLYPYYCAFRFAFGSTGGMLFPVAFLRKKRARERMKRNREKRASKASGTRVSPSDSSYYTQTQPKTVRPRDDSEASTQNDQ